MAISRVLAIGFAAWAALHCGAMAEEAPTAGATAPAVESPASPAPTVPASPPASAALPAAAMATPDAASAQTPAAAAAPIAPETPEARALSSKISALPADGSDEEKKERETLIAVYSARAYAPVWMANGDENAKAAGLAAEFANAASWGLDPRDFSVPLFPHLGSAAATPPDAVAEAELTFSLSALKYVRFARGGRIINPTEQLDSNLDRRPQLIEPKDVLESLFAADDPAAYLAGTNPQHVQFKRLRQKYLAAVSAPARLSAGPDLTPGVTNPQVSWLRRRLGVRVESIGNKQGDENHYDSALEAAVASFKQDRKLEPADGTVDAATRAALSKAEKVDAKRLLANMEMWRWMPADMGDVYMIANVPEFMIRLMKNGEMLHTERIVAGELGKQTTIFSRPLKHIVFRPLWRVPESIKVRELWPSLLHGGGLFRQYGLELQTKDGKPLNYTSIDWSKADIRTYEVVQPPGGKSVLGVVKFSFPSQHTIYMHDTPDKWMFNASQRTLSHGCLRLRNPLRMAELILAEDKGWDAAKIADLIKDGPLNNEVPIDKKIRMHITYFTQWVDDTGALKSYADVYGHEKRVTQALAGKWNEIVKGRDHLAPVELESANIDKAPSGKRQPQTKEAYADFLGSFFGAGGN